MKRLILLFLCILFLQKAVAQIVFCPLGAKWNYEFDNGYFSGSSHNESITYVKDSVIDNETVKIIWNNWFFTHYNPLSNGTGQTYIKQYGDTIFMKNKWTNHQWQILYNFAAQQGDSWMNAFSDGSTAIVHYTTTVNSVGTTTIGGKSLKQLQVNYTNYLDIPYRTYTVMPHQGTITERFGSNIFLFNYICGANKYNSNWREFLCYTDNDIGQQQFGAKSCNYSNPVGFEENNPYELKIYPNPIKDAINVERDFGESEIVITDLNGRIVKQELLNNEDVNTSELIPGMYFLQIRRNGELVYKTKIVKE